MIDREFELRQTIRGLSLSCQNLADLIDNYRRLTYRIKKAKEQKDWDELNMCILELCELESDFKR